MSDPANPNPNKKKHDAFDWAGIIIAGLGLIAIVVYTSVSYWQAHLTKQALVFGNQAFVYMSGEPMGQFVSAQKVWPIAVSWTNSGNTPALSAQGSANIKAFETPLTSDFNFPDLSSEPKIPATIPPKGQVTSAAMAFSYADAAAIRDGGKFGYIWGSITYHDILDRSIQHVTQFCAQLINVVITDPPKQVTGGGKSPASNINSLPQVAMSVLPCAFHNCSDEDCKVKRPEQD